MREYILTDKERQIIKKFIDTGEKLEGYAMLLSRINHMQTITKDLQLIEKFKTTAKGEKP